MNDDDRDRAGDAGDAMWIESLGLSADEESLIRHSLDMADAVIERDDAGATRGGNALEPDADAPAEDAASGPPDVREGPTLPGSERTEPYVQPRPAPRVVSRTNRVAERRRR